MSKFEKFIQIFQNIFKKKFRGAELIIYPTYFSSRLKSHYSDHTVAVYTIKKRKLVHQIPVIILIILITNPL